MPEKNPNLGILTEGDDEEEFRAAHCERGFLLKKNGDEIDLF